MDRGTRSPNRAMAAAATLLRDGRLPEAGELCRRLLSDHPADPGVHQLAALVAAAAGNATGALAHARSSLRFRPAHSATLVIAGKAAMNCADNKSALDYFRHAAELAPEAAEPAFLLCIGELAVGDANAQASLAALLARFPDDAPGWSALGSALENAGKADAALAAFSRAARHGPSVALHLRIGALLRRMARFEESAAQLRHAIALAPDFAPAWFALGVTEQDRSNHAAAVDAYRRALRIDPAMAEAAVNLGICLQQTGALAAAKQAYGRALHLRADTFGRISQALTMAPKGELWLDLHALRASLLAASASAPVAAAPAAASARPGSAEMAH